MIVKKLVLQNATYEIYLDEQDEGIFESHRWYVRKKRNVVYLETFTYKPNGKFGGVGLHRLIMNVSESSKCVDHINGNGLDNRRENLRICTVAQNAMNRTKQKNNKTGFKGVSLDRRTGKFKANINQDGKRKHVGVFESAAQAARAYDEIARKLYGQFAVLNFPTMVD